MTEADLNNKLNDKPFQAFRIRLSNNSTMDILDPNSIVVSATSAVLPLETAIDSDGFIIITRWRTIALAHIVEFTDIDPPKSHARRKRPS